MRFAPLAPTVCRGTEVQWNPISPLLYMPRAFTWLQFSILTILTPFVKNNILNYLQFYIEIICIFAAKSFTTIKLDR